MEQFQQPPKIRMQDRIASCNIEIGQAVVNLTEIETVTERILHLPPVHGIRFFTGISRKNVTVPAPLVTFIRNVPLKSEILFRLRKILLHISVLALPY